MTGVNHLEPVFVDSIPSDGDLVAGKLYISILYTTTVHLCASGCGFKVVLPLSPAQYRFEFDGVDVSMSPSVGNWDYPCGSHYWIRRGRVVDAGRWGDERLDAAARNDQEDVEAYYAESSREATESTASGIRVFFGRLLRHRRRRDR